MITTAYARTMARYNQWQNGSLYGAADGLSEDQRRRDRGAFFGSIHGTFNHLLWADQIWLHRFSAAPKPAATSIAQSVGQIEDWAELKRERAVFDMQMIDWATGLREDDIAGELRWYSGALGKEVTNERALLLTHIFNHQTHHRGQLHAMLTAAGARPDATDLAFMPETFTGVTG